MLVHAGGFSQRLPHLSAVGKIFLTLPCGEHKLHLDKQEVQDICGHTTLRARKWSRFICK